MRMFAQKEIKSVCGQLRKDLGERLTVQSEAESKVVSVLLKAAARRPESFPRVTSRERIQRTQDLSWGLSQLVRLVS